MSRLKLSVSLSVVCACATLGYTVNYARLAEADDKYQNCDAECHEMQDVCDEIDNDRSGAHYPWGKAYPFPAYNLIGGGVWTLAPGIQVPMDTFDYCYFNCLPDDPPQEANEQIGNPTRVWVDWAYCADGHH